MPSHAEVIEMLTYDYLRRCRACLVRPAANGRGGYCPACGDDVKPTDGSSYDDAVWDEGGEA